MKSLVPVSKGVALTAASAMFLFVATGCASVGHMSGQTETSVQLNQDNYKTIKAGAIGKSYGFALLGILPIVSPNYADAKASLYKSVGVPLAGKAVALANQTEDRSVLYLILFSIPRVTITADVIEFTGQTTSNPPTTQ